jgi:hypothetical protein
MAAKLAPKVPTSLSALKLAYFRLSKGICLLKCSWRFTRSKSLETRQVVEEDRK